jgi:hypothetical protein
MHRSPAVALALVLLVSACSSSVDPDEDFQWGHRVDSVTFGETGFIHRAGPGLWAPSTPLRIHVLFDFAELCGVLFSLNDETEIMDARSGSMVPSTDSILTAGAVVQVEYRFVNQSCPGQSYALSVVRRR